MIDRVSSRATFASFSRGSGARCGPVTVRFVAGGGPAPAHPAVAYAITRRVGNAVVRNRIRRRLREVLRALDAEGELLPGAYLVSAGRAAATMPFSELSARVGEAIGRATGNQPSAATVERARDGG